MIIVVGEKIEIVSHIQERTKFVFKKNLFKIRLILKSISILINLDLNTCIHLKYVCRF